MLLILKDVKHSELSRGVRRALTDKKVLPDGVDIEHLELCYPPIIQSSGNHRFEYNVGSDQSYLQSGVIVCSFGIRYKSYCSNISRTLLLTNPSEAMQMNYDFLQSLEKELLKHLIPGVKLSEVHHAGLEYAKKVRPDLIEHLPKTFGFAIGIEFQDSSVVIGPQCMALVKENMVFNVCAVLNGLVDNSAPEADSKIYALAHSDTVIVNSSLDPATILTATDVPPYLKLIVDCWERIMDFLSFEDLLRMGQTCKAINLLAGHYLRDNFPDLYLMKSEGIDYYLQTSQNLQSAVVPEIFWQSIKGLMVGGEAKFGVDTKSFPALKSLYFLYNFIETHFHSFTNVLINVENIVLFQCVLTGDKIDMIVNGCPNLKRLLVKDCNISDTAADIWFSKVYPALEHLVYIDRANTQMKKVSNFSSKAFFLIKHPNLKRFETNAHIFWTNRTFFEKSNIQLDFLGIIFCSASQNHLIKLFKFVKILQYRGFYKSLHLGFNDFENIDFETLCTGLVDVNVKKLSIDSARKVSADKIEFFARNFKQLKHLLLRDTSFYQILPFVRHSKNLKTIEIVLLNNNYFDLFTLNEERKKLENAVKVTIHSWENVYLKEMWKSKNSNFEHVEIARSLENPINSNVFDS